MSRRNPESRDFALGLAVTGLIVGGFFAYTHWYAPGNPPSSAKKQPDSTRKSLPVIATVYECNGDNGRVLSDKPCGDDARVREVVQPNLMPGSASTEPAR
jgi:hypothetical protein